MLTPVPALLSPPGALENDKEQSFKRMGVVIGGAGSQAVFCCFQSYKRVGNKTKILTFVSSRLSFVNFFHFLLEFIQLP